MVDRYTSYRGDTRDETSCHYSNQLHYPSSFSSTLLDAIYRSIEEQEHPVVENDHKAEPQSKKKHRGEEDGGGNVLRGAFTSDKEEVEESAKFRGSWMIEKWIDQKTLTGNVVAVQRSKHQPDSVNMKKSYRKTKHQPDSYNSYSSSGSSSKKDSCHGFFSETLSMQRQKLVWTHSLGQKHHQHCGTHNHGVRQGGHTHGGEQCEAKPSTKVKMNGGDYSKKKKNKKPISPGAKLAGLFSSLLLMRSKPINNKISIDLVPPNCRHDSSKSTTSSTCSSTSSFSRSCLSKTPSSRGKPKRSVRFSVADDNNNIISTKTDIREQDLLMVHHVMAKSHRQVEEVKNHPKKNHPIELRFDQHEFEEEEDDDDAASYSSSDLFELDINLPAIGLMDDQQIRRIAAHELPVFETTYQSPYQCH